MINKILVTYYSLGGNTEYAAMKIREILKANGEDCELLPLSKNTNLSAIEISNYSLVFLGTPSYTKGKAPQPVIRFLRYFIKENNYALPPFSCFGTGDTQWGEFLYCRAVDEIEYHLKSKTEVVSKIKIEQRPVNRHQINKINDYVIETLRGI